MPSLGETKKWYGTSGNSFVAVVEFGERAPARAVTAGGESGHPVSPHFNDEAKRYSTADLRDAYFLLLAALGHTAFTQNCGCSKRLNTIRVAGASAANSDHDVQKFGRFEASRLKICTLS